MTFKNPTGLARVATGMLVAYMVFKSLLALGRIAFPPDDPMVAVPALLYLLSLFACYIVVGMWIYRTNANTHALGAEMSTTPGWAIGWFFVPFANLIMPFQAMKEVWTESHQIAGRHEEAESPLVGWWWGLWIASNISSNLVYYFGGASPDALELARYIELIAAGISIAASVVLIMMMRRLDEAQLAASSGSVFA
jgi:hypothetical protein